jgi:hypothetical protein
MDDGAYVLGALGPADRAAFEEHLPGCASCREGVAGLAALPGLLGRLDTATIEATEAAPVPPTLLQKTLAAAAARKKMDARRRRRDIVGALASALTLAVVVGIGVHLVDNPSAAPAAPDPAVSLVAMRPAVGRAPVTAKVGAYEIDGGTRIVMTCRYASAPAGRWVLRLVVYPKTGGEGDQIATWMAAAGQEVSLDATTHLAIAEIGRIELHRADGAPLLVWKSA